VTAVRHSASSKIASPVPRITKWKQFWKQAGASELALELAWVIAGKNASKHVGCEQPRETNHGEKDTCGRESRMSPMA